MSTPKLPTFDQDPEYRQNCVNCLLATKVILDRLGVDFWLDFGTLLGAERHGDLIPNDDDIDVAMRAEDWTPAVAQAFLDAGFQLYPWPYEAKLGERFFSQPRADGLGWIGVRHASLAAYRAWQDIFLYFDGPGVRYPGRSRFYPEYQNKGVWEQPAELVEQLKEVPFLGTTFKVPHDSAAYLANLYGPGWRTPQPRGAYGYGNFTSIDAPTPPPARTWRRKVSVVLPSYNHLAFLPRAVSGILNQSFQDFELIIVNDGSQDGTAAYLATLTDPRVIVINRDNGGLPSALNRGFAEAGGEYRTWTSADNVTSPVWLEELVQALDAAPANVGFVNSNFAIIDEDDHLVRVHRGSPLNYDSLAAKNAGVASFLYRSTVAEQVGDYDVSLNGAEDWDMWLRILDVCDAAHVDSVLYYYRVHSNSMTSSMPDKVATASRSVLDKLQQRHGGTLDLDRFYPALRHAPDQAQARWQAKARLASFLTESPFCPASVSAQLLVEALRERFSSTLHGNLLRLLVLHGAWDFALQSADEVAARLPSPQLSAIRAGLASRDPAVLELLPLHCEPVTALPFALGHTV